MAAETTVNLDQFETKAVFELEPRAAGTHLRQMMIRGNAVLSSVYVKAASPGATLKVNYFDTTSGDNSTGERYDLTSHALLTDAAVGQTVRLLIPRIHNKPQVEALVTGTVEFGVYVTVVGDFPVDLRGQLLDVAVAETPGRVLEAAFTLDPSPLGVDVISETVPPGATWRLRYAEVISRGHGRWNLYVDGERVAAGVTGPFPGRDRAEFPAPVLAGAGAALVLDYTYSHGPAGLDVDAFVGITEG